MNRKRYDVKIMKKPLQKKNKQPKTKKDKIKGKKLVIIIVFLIIIIVACAQLLYSYVIPRVTLDLKTTYHEATGGGGTGGLININSKIINSGTVAIDDLIITVSLFNSTKTLLANETYVDSRILPDGNHELKLVANGNCYETFYIRIELQFFAAKTEYYEQYVYTTHEDTMNIGFEDSIFDWGF